MTNQERYEELKAIPYVKRNGEQREEYRKLDVLFQGEQESAMPEETVTIKKTSVEALMARIEALESLNTSNERQLGLQPQEGKWSEQKDKVVVHTARFKVYRETGSASPSLIVDWKWEKDLWNAEKRTTEQIYKITLRDTEGQLKTIEMTIADFAHIGESVQVSILKKEVTNMVKVDGFVRKRHVGEDYKVEEGEKVPYRVTEQKTICTVKLPNETPWNGVEFTINADRLNA